MDNIYLDSGKITNLCIINLSLVGLACFREPDTETEDWALGQIIFFKRFGGLQQILRELFSSAWGDSYDEPIQQALLDSWFTPHPKDTQSPDFPDRLKNWFISTANDVENRTSLLTKYLKDNQSFLQEQSYSLTIPIEDQMLSLSPDLEAIFSNQSENFSFQIPMSATIFFSQLFVKLDFYLGLIDQAQVVREKFDQESLDRFSQIFRSIIVHSDSDVQNAAFRTLNIFSYACLKGFFELLQKTRIENSAWGVEDLLGYANFWKRVTKTPTDIYRFLDDIAKTYSNITDSDISIWQEEGQQLLNELGIHFLPAYPLLTHAADGLMAASKLQLVRAINKLMMEIRSQYPEVVAKDETQTVVQGNQTIIKGNIVVGGSGQVFLSNEFKEAFNNLSAQGDTRLAQDLQTVTEMFLKNSAIPEDQKEDYLDLLYDLAKEMEKPKPNQVRFKSIVRGLVDDLGNIPDTGELIEHMKDLLGSS